MEKETVTTRTFPFRVLLTVTTGRLLCKPLGPSDNGISALYEILEWMTGEAPLTHQLPRFVAECRPWLLRWFPELGKVKERLGNLKIMLGAARAGDADRVEVVEQWLATEQSRCALQHIYCVPQIPADDHERKDPYDELVAMRGTDAGIIVAKIP